MNDRQRLEEIVSVVCKYLPPDGISREEAMTEIISLIDPLPEQIRLDETKGCARQYLGIMRDAVEQAVLKEREACAQVCDEASLYFEYDHASPAYSANYCANEIRQRGEQ